jgi:predicted Zn-dependent protease
MHNKILKDSAVLLFLIILSLIIVLSFVKYTGSKSGNEKVGETPGIISEKALGKLVKQQILIDAKIADAPLSEKALTTMLDILVADESFPYDVEIILVNSNTINAVALPGGIIVIYSGLIKAVDNPSQLISVLAHEMGHLYYRDSFNSVIRSIGISVIVSILDGGNSKIITDIIENLLSKSYSRDIEERADDYALDLLAERGIDPGHLGTFFQILEGLYESSDEKYELMQYFNTHPEAQNRIIKSEKASYTFSKSNNSQNINLTEINWTEVKLEQDSFFL